MSAGLKWHAIWRANCGSQGQGRVAVYPRGDKWTFVLDMLPGDQEPQIHGALYPTDDFAKLAAERQVAAWPSLVEGARRD